MTGRMMQYGSLLAIVYLAAACSEKESAAPANRTEVAPAPNSAVRADAADQRLVLAFGDSLYAGYNLGPNEGLAPALERVLKSRGIAARVVNGGVSGDTSGAALARLAFTLDGLPRKPDLMLVGLGGNDMLRGLDPAAARENLGAILAEAQRRGIKVMLTGMLASPNMGDAYARRFNAIYPELAKRYGATLYPFILKDVIGKPTLLLPDGVHPNKEGVAIIAANLAPLVAGAIEPGA